MLLLEFDVQGDPAPQGSKNAFVVNGRARIVEAAGKKLKDWRKTVTAAAFIASARSNHTGFPLDAPIMVEVTFFMPKPKTVKLPWFPWHTKTPDLDKMIRAVLDAVTDAGVWVDDSRVCRIVAEKVYADVSAPGAHVQVSTLM